MTDVIGRYGGEEFAVALPDIDSETAIGVIDEVREAFAQIKHYHVSGDFSVTLSCGVAMYPDHDDVTTLTEAADKALYRAKEAGRNRVVLADG